MSTSTAAVVRLNPAQVGLENALQLLKFSLNSVSLFCQIDVALGYPLGIHMCAMFSDRTTGS